MDHWVTDAASKLPGASVERVNGGAEGIYRQDSSHMVLPQQSKEVIGKPGTVVFAGRRAESPAARIVKRRSSSVLDTCGGVRWGPTEIPCRISRDMQTPRQKCRNGKS